MIDDAERNFGSAVESLENTTEMASSSHGEAITAISDSGDEASMRGSEGNSESLPSHAGESQPAEQPPASASPASESPSAESGPGESLPENGSEDGGARRFKIGSQRDSIKDIPVSPAKPAPQEPLREMKGQKQVIPPPLVASDKVPHTAEIPNLRMDNPEDVEALVAQELGNANLDQLVASSGSAVELAVDTRVRGKVASIHMDTVFFDLPGGRQGAVPQQKFKSLPALGSEHEVVVRGVSQEDGVFELSLPGATMDVAAWDDLTEGALVEAKITGANIGGLECVVSGIRGFIPASQIAVYRVENLSEFIGQKIECLVVEAKRSKRNLVLSRRAILEREQEESRKQLLASIKEGEVREGIVRSLQAFGAFIDLGGIDGLIHISKLSWERIKHPSEVLEVGQKIKVKIEKINPQTGKITLLFSDLAENPWLRAADRYPSGAKVKGNVSRIAEFGAFVKLEPGIEGLIHISELAYGRVWRASDVVKEGQEVETKVLNVDPENQRISLSLKALLPPPANAKKKEEEPVEEVEVRPAAANPKRNKALKGGISRPSGGEQFGLKW